MAGSPSKPSRDPWRRVAVAIALIVGSLGAWRLLDPTGIPFLTPDDGAQWIRRDRPFRLEGFAQGEGRTEFRHRIENARASSAAVVVRVLGHAEIAIDDDVMGATRAEERGPFEGGRFALPSGLRPGAHDVAIVVENPNGPAVLLARGEGIDLRSDGSWEARLGEEPWSPVALAASRARPALSERFPTAASALAARAPLLAAVFAAAFAASLLLQRRGAPSSATWRALLVVAWAVLLVNDAWKLPPGLGFDTQDHLDYVRWIAEHGRLPHPLEGWQMFQAPLFYLVAAPFDALFRTVASPESASRLLRLLPLLCGLLQVEIGFRAARWAFPGRDDLHVVAAVVSGFAPMNLVMAQYVGNEPFAALLSGIAIVATLRLLAEPERACRPGPLVLLGVVLGLAILSKVTALLLVPPIAIAAAWSARRSERGPIPAGAAPAIVLLSTAAIAGWFFIRNLALAGVPLVLSSASQSWWQDPGYRVASHLTHFGEALAYPIFAGAASIGDGLWSTFWLDGQLSSIVLFERRPPWNYEFVLAGAWLGLIPALAMLAGAVTALRRLAVGRPAVVFAIACSFLYIGAIAHQALHVPYHSVAKATYMLGLLPVFGVLAAAGISTLPGRAWVRALGHAAIACWAVWAWLGYFVVETALPLTLK